MAEQGSGGNSVQIVAILAVLVLVALAAWYFTSGQAAKPAATAAPPAAVEKKSDSDINVKVDLPDSVTIKP